MVKNSTIKNKLLIATGILSLLTLNSFCLGVDFNKGFKENKGQISDQHFKPRPDVLFTAVDGDLICHFKKTGVSYQINKVKQTSPNSNTKSNGASLQKLNGLQLTKFDKEQSANEHLIYRIDLNWLNSNPSPIVLKGSTLDGFDNYYTEVCPNGVLEVKSYQDISYQNVYQGINLKWYQKNGSLKYDYLVSAGANYKQIQLKLSGAIAIKLNNKAELVIVTPLGEIIEQAPSVIQNGHALKAEWVINGDVISFEIKGIDPTQAFIIDPLIRLWGSYYGGTGYDWIGTNYTDSHGNLYIAGGTTSSNLQTIATTGAFQTTYAGSTSNFGDCFLVKLSGFGQRIWGTYFGGSGIDFAYACAVDPLDDIYIGGGTTSTNSAVMTTAGAYQTTYLGGSANNTGDALIAKFNSSGQRIWSTYFGEVGNEICNGVNCDTQGNLFFTGITGSTSNTYIASPGAHQSNFGGGVDGFLAKFNSAGARLWSTYYGGNGDDQSFNCITDANGNVYIGGVTSSTAAISTPGSHQPNYGGGASGLVFGIGDAFMVKFNATGVRQWGTYYGGAGDDAVYYVAIDAQSNVYFSGSTSTNSGTSIATASAHQVNYGGGNNDAMLVKLDPSGQRLWGTYYGGANIEEFCCCFVDQSNGFVYMSGNTGSGGTAIASPCSYQTTIGGSRDAFLCKFNLQGNRLWATYYGGTAIEDWSALTVDAAGTIYLCGETNSSGSSNASVITSTGAHQTTYGGGTYDAFVVKFDACIPVAPPAITNTLICKGQSTQLNSLQTCGINWYSDSTLTNLVSSNSTFSTGIISGDTTFYFVDVSCGLPSVKSVAHLTVVSGPSISVQINPTQLCGGESCTLTPVGAINYTWVGSSSLYSLAINPFVTSTYTLSGTMYNGGCATKTTVTVLVNPCLNINEPEAEQHMNTKVYPNPCRDYLIIESEESCSILITDQLGRLIKHFETQTGKNNVLMDDVKEGIYLMITQNASGKQLTKIIIQ